MCGGGDSQNMIYKSLKWIKETNAELFIKINWKVVIGAYYPYKKILEHIVEKNHNIQLLVNVRNMAELMKNCDLCITAASTVLYECCAMQLPTLFVVVAEDQEYDAEAFQKNGLMIYCGNFKDNPEYALDKVEKSLRILAFDKKTRQKMKNDMGKIVDGYGAKRIAEMLVGGKR